MFLVERGRRFLDHLFKKVDPVAHLDLFDFVNVQPWNQHRRILDLPFSRSDLFHPGLAVFVDQYLLWNQHIRILYLPFSRPDLLLPGPLVFVVNAQRLSQHLRILYLPFSRPDLLLPDLLVFVANARQ
jgi:hypothetical protein